MNTHPPARPVRRLREDQRLERAWMRGFRLGRQAERRDREVIDGFLDAVLHGDVPPPP